VHLVVLHQFNGLHEFFNSALSRAFFIFANNFVICFRSELKARKISQAHINMAVYVKY